MTKPHLKIPRDFKLFVIISLTVVLVGLIVFRHYYSGMIVVNSNPPATTFINGKQVAGKEFKLMPGDYKIEIKTDGYIPFSQSAHIGTGLRTEVNATLKPLPVPAKISDNASYLESVNNTLYFGCSAAICSYDPTAKIFNALSDAVYPDLAGLKINPANNQLALVKKGANWGMLDFARYNLVDQSFKDFGTNISDLVYNSTSDKIFYFERENELRILRKANLNKSEVKNLTAKIEGTVANPRLELFNDQTLMFVDRDVYVYDFSADKVNKLTTTSSVSRAYFTPEGKIIYSVLSPLPDAAVNYNWSIMDANGQNKKNLDFQSVSPLLIFFDNKNVLVFSGQTFDKINLEGLDKISYYFAGEIKLKDMVISNDKKSVFYTSDGKLWEVALISQ